MSEHMRLMSHKYNVNGTTYPIVACTDGTGWLWGIEQVFGHVRWNENTPFDTRDDAIADAKIVIDDYQKRTIRP